jgi:hypothetical protein
MHTDDSIHHAWECVADASDIACRWVDVAPPEVRTCINQCIFSGCLKTTLARTNQGWHSTAENTKTGI